VIFHIRQVVYATESWYPEKRPLGCHAHFSSFIHFFLIHCTKERVKLLNMNCFYRNGVYNHESQLLILGTTVCLRLLKF